MGDVEKKLIAILSCEVRVAGIVWGYSYRFLLKALFVKNK